MTEDLEWLEGPTEAAGALVIPVHGLTKRELSAATGYVIKQIDKLCRDGLPCRTTGSNRGGLRFDLPVVIEWIAAQREAEAAGDTDGTLAEAKRRIALAQARRIELENAKEEGRLLNAEVVGRHWQHITSTFRNRLYQIEYEFFLLSNEQREQIRASLNSALTDLSQTDYLATFEWPSEN